MPATEEILEIPVLDQYVHCLAVEMKAWSLEKHPLVLIADHKCIDGIYFVEQLTDETNLFILT